MNSSKPHADAQGIAATLMNNFNMKTWFDMMHDDLVLEFPYAASIGMPPRVAGKPDCVAYLAKVMESLPGLKFTDIDIRALPEPDSVVVEYKGGSGTAFGHYENIYVCFQQYRDGKLVLFREYWNTKPVIETFGVNPSAAFT
jgi:uncharacterized protein